MNSVYWLIAAAVFIIIEILTLGLTTIWFAGGALAVAVVSMLGGSFGIQAVLFIVVSVVLLYFTRPLAQKYFNGKVTKTNAESLVGRNCIVTKDIDNINAHGQVVVNGQEWTARSTDENIKIPEGTTVIIRKISGVKLIVEQEQEG